MMSNIKKHLPLIVRILVSALFLLSAVAKSFPIWAFEKQMVDLGIIDWCYAPHLARLIIALETAIAIAILQKHYLKTFVVPVTIILLIGFCAHLGIQMVEHGAMNGNCGCFGQLIPMTPLEAFIKNVITILLLVYLYRNVENKPKGENKFVVILFIYFLSAFIMFFFFPFCPCSKTKTPEIIVPQIISDTTTTDSLKIDSTEVKDTSKGKGIDIVKQKDTAKKIEVDLGPLKVVSKFAIYNNFSGKSVNLDEGKKIVCLFVPGCDHCRDAAKELAILKKKNNLPPIYILFMDEETFKIPEFFTETKSSFPYYVMSDIPAFFKLLGNKATTPGINYLWNGNIIKAYQGIEDQKFNGAELVKIITFNQK
jgi:hypothetical protein